MIPDEDAQKASEVKTDPTAGPQETMPSVAHDISVIFSTYNRASMLQKTLEAMEKVDRNGLDVEFVVVDNNSSDDTALVLESFKDRLPLLALFESRAGKNIALNHALNTARLGDIVVFTDDDIVPNTDWFHRIADACARWPQYSVFGGKIYPIWPEGAVLPRWAEECEALRSIMFSIQDFGSADVPYDGERPFGPNFWVRGSVFAEGRRYNEGIGPRPGSYKMGSENSFLLQLEEDGFKSVFIHDAVVGHHVQPSLLSTEGLIQRFIRSGRGLEARVGVNHRNLLLKNKFLWYLRMLIAVGHSRVRIRLVRRSVSSPAGAERIAHLATCLGYDLESLRMVKLHGQEAAACVK